MNLLAFDTTGPVIGVGLYHDDQVTTRMERVSRGADARLLPWANELVAEAGLTMDSIAGVAVSSGPGSFTGLRVGLATAMALAFALEVPIWGGSSLETRARAVRLEAADRPILAMLDARKQRVYAALFSPTGERIGGPGDVSPETALAWPQAEGGFLATGEGALVYEELVLASGGTLATRAGSPAVEALARLGASRIQSGQGMEALELRPEYMRAPDAKPPKSLGG